MADNGNKGDVEFYVPGESGQRRTMSGGRPRPPLRNGVPTFADADETPVEIDFQPPAPAPGAIPQQPLTPQPEQAAPSEAPAQPPPEKPRERPIEDEPDEPDELAFDWLTEVAIPIGIFGLLGCLLYYLVDLRQALGGQFSSGLRWVCFWFLMAAILITRMRTKYGSQTIAIPYVLGLALATGLFVVHFTLVAGGLTDRVTAGGLVFSLFFNIALVVLIWWGADKVTRECTVEENIEHATSQGFFTDLDTSSAAQTDGKANPRHPGRVIFWVSVAAVLVFGLGTRRVGDDSITAAHAFWSMAGYVFFALLLLALTNLSAIRMDVRRRKVRMGWNLVPTWIAMSLALVITIVLISSFLPRPRTDRELPFAISERVSWLRDPGRGIGGDMPASGISDTPSPHTSAPGRQPETNGEGVPTESGPSDQQGQAGQDQGAGSASADGAEGGGSQSDGGGAGEAESSASGGGQGGGEGAAGEGGQGESGANETTEENASGTSGGISWWWLLLLLLLLALIIYLLIRYRKQIMPFLRTLVEPFRAMWLAFLAFLERLKRMLGLGRGGFDEFADLPEDPFADIWEQRELGANMTPSQIVRHVYRAFLGFCSLRGHPRPDFQTEFEFLRTVPPKIGLEPDDQKRLTGMYVSATYSPSEVSHAMVDRARDIWTRLRPAIDTALAAQSSK